MHLYYFSFSPDTAIRWYSDIPLENKEGFIEVVPDIKIPSKNCFYYDGSMCLYSAPKEISDLIDRVTDSLDNVVMFFSGFQKFVAPIMTSLSGEEKSKFKEALYSLNSYQILCEEPPYCHLLMFYLEFLCSESLSVSGNDLNPICFFDAIRKDKA